MNRVVTRSRSAASVTVCRCWAAAGKVVLLQAADTRTRPRAQRPSPRRRRPRRPRPPRRRCPAGRPDRGHRGGPGGDPAQRPPAAHHGRVRPQRRAVGRHRHCARRIADRPTRRPSGPAGCRCPAARRLRPRARRARLRHHHRPFPGPDGRHHAHRGQRGDGPRRPLRGGDPRPGSQPALRPDRSVRRRLPTRPSPTPGGRRELRTVLATNRIPTTATETWAANHPGEPVPLPPPVPAWRPEPAVVGRGAERPVTPRRAAPSAMPSSPVPPVHVADRSPSR